MPELTLKTNARKLLHENSPKIFITSVIYIIIFTVMSEFEFRLPGLSNMFDFYIKQYMEGLLPDVEKSAALFRPSGVPLVILLWLLSSVIMVGYMSYTLKVARRQKSEIKDIFDGFLFFGKIILIKIVSNIIIALWSILLVFPGVIAYYRYRQAYFILIDDPKKGVLQCLRESSILMQGKKFNLFFFDLSFIIWLLLDFLVMFFIPLPFSLPIVSIWLTPFYGVSQALYYDKLRSKACALGGG